MKKNFVFRIISVVLFLAGLTSCDTETRDGDWHPMKWSAEQELSVDNNYYVIPAEGATVSFVCKNYSAPWMSDVATGGRYYLPNYETGDYKNIKGDWFAASTNENRLTVTFTENTASDRYISVTVTAGDIFYTFLFKQKGRKN
ncbi:MAG: hypothetical protein IKX65_04605 [Prevotella sp.]|nr:hypothetical protein [Prevotella sp.]